MRHQPPSFPHEHDLDIDALTSEVSSGQVGSTIQALSAAVAGIAESSSPPSPSKLQQTSDALEDLVEVYTDQCSIVDGGAGTF